MLVRRRLFLLFTCALTASTAGVASTTAAASSAGVAVTRPVAGPIGWETYRRLDLLPLLRSGANTYQAASTDPTNGNDDGFSGRYSCLRRVSAGCLMAEHHGPGELESVWTAGNQQAQTLPSGRLMIQIDDRTAINETWPDLVGGTSTSPFAFPLALGPQESIGGSSIQVPLPFRSSLRVISQFNPHYFHVVYRTFNATSAVAAAPRHVTFRPPDVLAELRGAGLNDPKRNATQGTVAARPFRLAPGQQTVVGELGGPGVITELGVRVTRYAAPVGFPQTARDFWEHARLHISFDGSPTVNAPLGEFFGSGLGPAPVRALMFGMSGDPLGWARAWWPMPFASRAVLTLENDSRSVLAAGWLQVKMARDRRWRARLAPGGGWGYFHADGHRGATQRGRYWVFLNTKGAGTFDGVTLTMAGGIPPGYLEGNERAYVDGATRPQILGTGTEDFFDSGWYFWLTPFTLPLSGFIALETSATGCPRLMCMTAYRLMIADGVPFGHSLLYEIEHGSANLASAIYSSTAYWYQAGATHSVGSAKSRVP